MLIFFAVFFYVAIKMQAGANRIPFLMSGSGLLLSAGLFLAIFKGVRRPRTTNEDGVKRDPFIMRFIKLPEVRLVCWLILFIAMIYVVGFIFAIALFLFLVVTVFYGESFKLGIAAAVFGVLFYYGLILKLLGVQTFSGILFSPL